MSRRAWVIGPVVGLLVLTGMAAFAVPRLLPHCGQPVTQVSGGRSSSPFLGSADRAEQPDRDRDALVAALDSAPAPFGEVLGAVGYHYEQWAQVSAFAQGIGVRTRDNPDFTMLDDQTLRPRWSVQVETRRSAYDAGDDRYLVATMPADTAPDLVTLDADNGHLLWCAHLDGSAVGADDPFATQILEDGGVVVLAPGEGSQERVVRLSGKDGSQRWVSSIAADRGGFLGTLGGGLLLAGGSTRESLLDPAGLSRRRPGQALVALSVATGKQAWAWPAPAGSGVHVLGTDAAAGIAVVEQRTRGEGRLFALDRDGEELWSARPTTGTGLVDATLRTGRVVVRSGSRWVAYDARDGRRLWQRIVPDRPQLLPYGFELGDVPLLDDDHALLAGTTALHVLDLRTGALTSAALPTDGINTTYWPYQVAVSPGLIAVATNTGAVVVRREEGRSFTG